jgi:methionyl-tRNA synthetase
MSKSVGNIVRAETVLEVLGADALRYFLLREISFGHDGNFTFEALIQRYNADLANGYGNLVSRVVNMVHKYFGGVVPHVPDETETSDQTSLRMRAESAATQYGDSFDEFNFSGALEVLWALVAQTDGYLTANAPWKKPAERSEAEHIELQARVLKTAAEAIRIITALAHPILPEATAKVWRQLGLGEIEKAAKSGELTTLTWGGLKPGTHFGEPAPLFPRAEKDAIDRMENLEKANNLSAVAAVSGEEPSTAGGGSPVVSEAKAPISALKVESNIAETVTPLPEPPVPVATAAPVTEAPVTPPASGLAGIAQIGIEDFAKVELRVAQILVAERIPKADKLLRLEVDLGYEKRQILAGIAQYYEPEKLIGRKVVIVANLAPRKMRGLESNGMIVAASVGDEGAPVLAGFLEEVPVGARLR